MPLPLPRWAVPLQLLRPQAVVLLLLLLCWLSLLPPSPQRFVSRFPPSAPEHPRGAEGCRQAAQDMQGGLRCLARCCAAQKPSGSCPWLLSSSLVALLPVWLLPEPCPARGAEGQGCPGAAGAQPGPTLHLPSCPAPRWWGRGALTSHSLSVCPSHCVSLSVRPSFPPVSCNVSSDGEAAPRGPSVAPAS